jgi:hypothetical protein
MVYPLMHLRKDIACFLATINYLPGIALDGWPTNVEHIGGHLGKTCGVG